MKVKTVMQQVGIIIVIHNNNNTSTYTYTNVTDMYTF